MRYSSIPPNWFVWCRTGWVRSYMNLSTHWSFQYCISLCKAGHRATRHSFAFLFTYLKPHLGKPPAVGNPPPNCTESKLASALRKSPDTAKPDDLRSANKPWRTSEMLWRSLREPETGVDMASGIPWRSVTYMALVVFLFLRAWCHNIPRHEGRWHGCRPNPRWTCPSRPCGTPRVCLRLVSIHRSRTTSESAHTRSCSVTPSPWRWRIRKHVPLTVHLQLVEDAQNDLQQVTFRDITAFCHQQMWQDFNFYCIFVQYFVHERSIYLGLVSQK